MSLAVRVIVETLAAYAFLGILLFSAGGTLQWPQAWIFLAQMILFSIGGGLWLARRDPALIAERLSASMQRDQPAADKFVLVAIRLLVCASLALMALDARRLAWSRVPLWAQGCGELCLLASVWLCFRVFAVNSFAAQVVKLQPERGHRAISDGPYRYARHPMYLGAIGFLAGTSLLLGSWWGLLGAAGFVALFAIRIPIEESVLRQGLEGYDAYVRKVPFRLLPGVW